MKPGNRSCTFDSGANSRSAKALKYEVEVCFEMSLLPWRVQKTFFVSEKSMRRSYPSRKVN